MRFGIINLHPPRQFYWQRTAILKSYATIFNCSIIVKAKSALLFPKFNGVATKRWSHVKYPWKKQGIANRKWLVKENKIIPFCWKSKRVERVSWYLYILRRRQQSELDRIINIEVIFSVVVKEKLSYLFSFCHYSTQFQSNATQQISGI